MGWSGVSIVSLSLIIIGVIMAVIGVILLMTTQTVQTRYDWILIGVGIAVAIFGGLLLASFHSTPHIKSDVSSIAAYEVSSESISALKNQSNPN